MDRDKGIPGIDLALGARTAVAEAVPAPIALRTCTGRTDRMGHICRLRRHGWTQRRQGPALGALRDQESRRCHNIVKQRSASTISSLSRATRHMRSKRFFGRILVSKTTKTMKMTTQMITAIEMVMMAMMLAENSCQLTGMCQILV